MIINNAFDNIMVDQLYINPENNNLLLVEMFGKSVGLPKLGAVASDIKVKTSNIYSFTRLYTEIKIDVSNQETPGKRFPTPDVSELITDVTNYNDIFQNGTLDGIYLKSVENHSCPETETCDVCNGNKSCTYCSSIGSIVCPDCDSTGKCTNCSGSGKSVCDECWGNGYCNNCHGSGTVSCAFCDGTGKCQECDGSGDCQECDGSGNCQECDGSGDCQECDGDGTVNCNRCHGDGEIHCPDCNGSGIYADYRCRKCNGTGTIGYWEGQKTCSVCDGTGRYQITCKRCNGSGVIKCPSCHGSGEDYCEDCHGTGKCKNCIGSGECRQCHGSGKCIKCHGTGECSRCKGRGYFWCKECQDHDGKCIKCHGTGEIICSTCHGNGICTTCNGTLHVQCPECGGEKYCKKCNGTGKQPCKRCGGTGVYQTYQVYKVFYNQKTQICVTNNLYEQNRSQFGSVNLFKQALKQWINKYEFISFDEQLNLGYGNVAKTAIDWSNKCSCKNEKTDYCPYSIILDVNYVPSIIISYKIGKRCYSFTIVGSKKAIVYDNKPKQIDCIIEKVKNGVYSLIENLKK